jgi:hypothetical protein
MNALEILAAVLTVVMSINGWFLKGIYSDMQFVKIELAKLITSHDNTKQDAAVNAKEIYKMRERVHTLEGAYSQMLQFINDYEQEKRNGK